MTAIPFIRDFEFEYGRCDRLSDRIRRVIAPNPGPFTYTGTGVYIIGHGEVSVIDPGPVHPDHIEAIDRALASMPGGAQLTITPDNLTGLLVKAEPSASGEIRGNRHVMSDDSDINGSRHARSLVGGVLAGRLGDTRLFVSGGAEHQGPNGGGPLALILRP